MRMRWCDLLFAHWPIDTATVRALVPDDLDIDTFNGRAWVGVVPFRMEDVGVRGLPAPPILGAFPELNVRTYVTYRGLSGVWFLSLDAANLLAVLVARRSFHLPYVWASMRVERDGSDIDYRSARCGPAATPASFRARYGPTGPVVLPRDGSFEAWATARERLFAVDPHGRIERTEVRHVPWPLQSAWADLDAGDLLAAHGLTVTAEPPRLAFARRLDVRAWWPHGASVGVSR